MTPLVRCPVCDGPVLYRKGGAATCVRVGSPHLYIPRAQQRVQAGEDLHDIIHYTVGR